MAHFKGGRLVLIMPRVAFFRMTTWPTVAPSDLPMPVPFKMSGSCSYDTSGGQLGPRSYGTSRGGLSGLCSCSVDCPRRRHLASCLASYYARVRRLLSQLRRQAGGNQAAAVAVVMSRPSPYTRNSPCHPCSAESTQLSMLAATTLPLYTDACTDTSLPMAAPN